MRGSGDHLVEVLPLDDHNRTLLSHVHPSDWVNPKPPSGLYNLVVIGAGTAGLVTAAGAAGLGAKVALIERNLMGGDCLNVGCVPSKALLRSARAVAEGRGTAALGVRGDDAKADFGAAVDFPAVMERVRRLRARIAPHDSARRFAGLGVDVYLGSARFTGPEAIQIGGTTLRFRRAVIATGARAAEPEIEGLAAAGYLTNETVFNLTTLPARLAVIGGGPIGCELAQAFRRLGSEVTLLHDKPHLLDREDADAAAIVERRFTSEGIRLLLGARVRRVVAAAAVRTVEFEIGGAALSVAADEILVGAGRRPVVEGLGLEAAGVAFDPRKGVRVDSKLRTTNPRIFAAGDVCMEWKFTHAADAAARIVIQNALFLGRKRIDALVMPWCTYTDPEVARVGLNEAEAARAGTEIETFTRRLADVDRAVLDGEEEGFVKVHVRKGTDRILGATIVARHAGEMIGELTLAMASGVGLGAISGIIHPYPTQAEAIKQAGDAYQRTRLTPFVKKALAKWLDWTR